MPPPAFDNEHDEKRDSRRPVDEKHWGACGEEVAVESQRTREWIVEGHDDPRDQNPDCYPGQRRREAQSQQRTVDMIAVEWLRRFPGCQTGRPSLADGGGDHHHGDQKAWPPEGAETVGEPPGRKARILRRGKRHLSSYC